MKIGLIGAGNMATALARGWREPVTVSDARPEKAAALAAEVGGRAASNAEVAEAADAVVLCHKPQQLDEVAGEIAGKADAVVSILGGVPLADVEAAYPDTPVYRFMPSIPVEVRSGVLCYAAGRLAGEGPESEVLAQFERLGPVMAVREELFDVATALMGCGPAFFAIVLEALVDAGAKRGLDAADATRMAVEAMAGTAAVLRASGEEPAHLRERVTSPGGMTERGLAELERSGLRGAFDEAVEAVAGR